MKSRKSFPLRIDPALYEALEAWAQQEFRSVNGQIEFLLREAVSRRRGRDATPPAPEEPTSDRDDDS
ncbi:MAG: hypothetical protein KJ000_05775 [Pirellulaceae bacterium]|nr:hypothetical protein [Pirellulaceae bacterium]